MRFVDREKAIDTVDGLKERNNSVQNTEHHESQVVLNRLPSDLELYGNPIFLFGFKFSG